MSYMESYEGTNPSGNTDTMCKIYIDSPETLRLSDCIPFTGVYTLQFWIKSGSASQVFLESDGIHRYIDATSEWVKHIYTFTVTDDSDRAIYFQFPIGVFYLYHVKLELGDTASNWTPAPDDSEIVITADEDTRLNRLSDKYTDKLGCDNGLWYIERNTQTIVLGSDGWSDYGTGYGKGICESFTNEEYLPALCDHFSCEYTYMLQSNQFCLYNDGEYIHMIVSKEWDTVEDFTTWLSTNSVKVLLPAESTTIRLANYVQGTLNNLIAKNNLSVYITEDNVHSMRGHIVVEPIVFGTVNEDMSATIVNGSDESIGFIYEIHCKDEVTDPAIYLSETNEHIKLDGLFIMDDVITIDTRRGHKSVTKTYRGHTTNIINQFVNTSKWLQLQSGVNHLIQSAESGAINMDSRIIYTNEYEGV